MNKEDALQQFISEVKSSRKYRALDLPLSTLTDIFEREWSRLHSAKETEKSARHKLHNVIAPYLGDPDYQAAANALDQAFEKEQIEGFCLEILGQHASTRERIPILTQFYEKLFQVTGVPNTILDLACGLNPFALSWMKLSKNARYYAYDIHQPRVGLINHFFGIQGMEPLAEVRDILVNPPEIQGDVAFLFKEAHRFEQRQRGCNLPLWEALKIHFLLVSLPVNNLTGKHNLEDRQRRLVYGILEDKPWPVKELLIGSELVFCIEKG